MAEKLHVDTGGMEMLMIMSEGNPGALTVLVGMINDPARFLDILLLDSLDIRGSHLYMLYNDCCGRSMEKFDKTLKMLRLGVFSKEEVRSNLERVYALPFIDDDTVVDGVLPLEENFGPSHPKWEKWCKAQRESFERRLRAAI